MASSDSEPQSFVVRIWLEETAEEAGRATWRGHITHVPSGTRRHVQDLCDITTFITLYLERMGVTVAWPCRLACWLHRLSAR